MTDIYFDPNDLQPETIEQLQEQLNIARFIRLLEAELPKLPEQLQEEKSDAA